MADTDSTNHTAREEYDELKFVIEQDKPEAYIEWILRYATSVENLILGGNGSTRVYDRTTTYVLPHATRAAALDAIKNLQHIISNAKPVSCQPKKMGHLKVVKS